jgi:integrase
MCNIPLRVSAASCILRPSLREKGLKDMTQATFTFTGDKRIVEALETLTNAMGGSAPCSTGMIQGSVNPFAGYLLRLFDVWKAFVVSPRRPDCSASTLESYRQQWNMFKEWSASTTMDRVDTKTVDAYCAHLHSRGICNGTFNKHVSLLSLVWRVLKVEPNPWAEVVKKKHRPISHRALTLDELSRLLKQVEHDEWHTAVMVGAYTGLRMGDVLTLRCGEIQAGGIVRVPMKTDRRSGGKVVRVPLHPSLAAEFPEWVHSKAESDFVLPTLAVEYQRDRSGVSRRFQCILERAGIVTSENGTVGFHSLRHTFVSMMRGAGVAESVVMSMVGHSSGAMTAHYTHTDFGAAQAAVGKLPVITPTAQG